jgi:hypothetical protein
MHRRLASLVFLGLIATFVSVTMADIPPSPEQKRKIADTPRIYAEGKITPLADRPFARTVQGGNAKIVIPKAVFDDLVAAVAKKGGDASPSSKKSGGIPPLALVIAGLALSGACIYFLAKAPRYRTVASTTGAVVILALGVLWTQSAEANAGPALLLAGKVTIEVSADAAEVEVFIREAAAKPGADGAKP